MDSELTTVSGRQIEMVKDREARSTAGYERPEISQLALQQEVAELKTGCSGKCLVTQAVSTVNDELTKVATECATCGRKRNADFKPAAK
jgi:hypothetical protein